MFILGSTGSCQNTNHGETKVTWCAAVWKQNGTLSYKYLLVHFNNIHFYSREISSVATYHTFFLLTIIDWRKFPEFPRKKNTLRSTCTCNVLTRKVRKFILENFYFISLWWRMYAFWNSFEIFWKLSQEFLKPFDSGWKISGMLD